MQTRQLALFDLDNTLLPTDSDYEWGQFLVRIGVVDGAEYARRNDQFYADYKAGTLDIYAFLRFALAPLAAHSRAQLAQWHAQFMAEVITPAIRPQALDLVKRHQDAGDLCCVVTATNSFVTRPIVERFGIDQLIATDPATIDGQANSAFTGEVAGTPCFREGKVVRMNTWLAEQGADWASFSRSYFYSDSANDIPLMEKVTNPIATNADERLTAHATQYGWQCLQLFAKATTAAA